MAHRDFLVRELMSLVGLCSSRPHAPVARKNPKIFFEMVQTWKQRIAMEKRVASDVAFVASGASSAAERAVFAMSETVAQAKGAVAGTVGDATGAVVGTVGAAVGAASVAGKATAAADKWIKAVNFGNSGFSPHHVFLRKSSWHFS